MDRLAFLLNLAATGVMIGLIWFVQVVHYPLFSRVGRDGYRAYHRAHGRRTVIVVALPMLVEAATGLWLALRPTPYLPAAWSWAGLGLIGVIWLSTAFLQVPEHGRLEQGFDGAAHRRLVLGNWIRTVAWTARGGLLLAALARIMSGA